MELLVINAEHVPSTVPIRQARNSNVLSLSVLINFQKYIDPIVYGLIFAKQTTDSSLSSILAHNYTMMMGEKCNSIRAHQETGEPLHIIFLPMSQWYISQVLYFTFWQPQWIVSTLEY